MDSAFGIKKRIINKNKLKYSNKKLESVLFSKGLRTSNFFTNNSGLYFDCNDKRAIEYLEIKTKYKFLDVFAEKAVLQYAKSNKNKKDYLYVQYNIFANKFRYYQDELIKRNSSFLSSFSILRLWNASILAAVVIGMISMSFIYRYLGSGVSANDVISRDQVEISYDGNDNKWTQEKENEFLTEMAEELKLEADRDFYLRAEEMVAGYPIEKMMPYIKEKDPQVAAFLIAIAKKESNWGKRVPVLNGEDCYNYWGYRGLREKMGTGGHTCFDSRKEAIDVVGKRIKELIEKYNRDTAQEMVVWKCGSSCAATGGQAAANKWISDVDMYLEKLNSTE